MQMSIRNNRFVLGMLFASGIVCLVATPCLVLIALSLLFPLADLSSDRMFGVLAWACGAYVLGSTGLFLYRRTPRMTRNHVRFAPEGIYFDIESLEHAPEIFFAWDEVRAVTGRRIAHIYFCTVQGSCGRSVAFDSFTFLRPKHVAYLITSLLEQNVPLAGD